MGVIEVECEDLLKGKAVKCGDYILIGTKIAAEEKAAEEKAAEQAC